MRRMKRQRGARPGVEGLERREAPATVAPGAVLSSIEVVDRRMSVGAPFLRATTPSANWRRRTSLRVSCPSRPARSVTLAFAPSPVIAYSAFDPVNRAVRAQLEEDPEILSPPVEVDAEIPLENVSNGLLDWHEQLAPFAVVAARHPSLRFINHCPLRLHLYTFLYCALGRNGLQYATRRHIAVAAKPAPSASFIDSLWSVMMLVEAVTRSPNLESSRCTLAATEKQY